MSVSPEGSMTIPPNPTGKENYSQTTRGWLTRQSRHVGLPVDTNYGERYFPKVSGRGL